MGGGGGGLEGQEGELGGGDAELAEAAVGGEAALPVGQQGGDPRRDLGGTSSMPGAQ